MKLNKKDKQKCHKKLLFPVDLHKTVSNKILHNYIFILCFPYTYKLNPVYQYIFSLEMNKKPEVFNYILSRFDHFKVIWTIHCHDVK